MKSDYNQTDLIPVKLTPYSKEYKEAKSTYLKSFPKVEQVPFWSLKFIANRKCVDFLCYYDSNNNYIGFSYSIHNKTDLMILYFAVDESARSKGYGTKIIKYLQNKDKIQNTVLDIESPLENCKNIEQRIRRYNFYKRLNFHSTDSEIIEPECKYLILSDSQIKNEKAVNIYRELTDKLSFHLCPLNIVHHSEINK